MSATEQSSTTDDAAPAAAPRRTLGQHVTFCCCVAFATLGFVVPTLLLVFGRGMRMREIVAGLLLGVVAILSDRLELEFTFGKHEISVSPANVPSIVAAIWLPPQVAALVVFVIILPELRRPSRGLLMNGGALSFTVYIAARLTQAAFGHPTPLMVLPAALAAAGLAEVVHIGEGLAYVESRTRGAARAYLEDPRATAIMEGFSVGLPTLACAVVAPFAASTFLGRAPGTPLHLALFLGLLLFVLCVFQIVTYFVLLMMLSEQVHRRRSEFLRETFTRYMPASVVEQLSEEEAEVTLGGELRDISVMFVDVRNFTSWSERLGPQQVITELNELMTELTQSIFASGGTLDKFTGDGLMAFWGAPVEMSDHADRACLTALDMLDRLDGLNARRRTANKPALYLGIGVHSGSALVGNVGHVDRLDYTAIGDTVNLAARLEAATKDAACSALVSQDTFALLQDEAFGPMECLGELHVKGREEPVEAYVLAHGVRGMAPWEADGDGDGGAGMDESGTDVAA
jgi:class 3 adenylate cyclase